MKIHLTIPYSQTKDLGSEYNKAFSLIPEEDWLCLLDYDCQLLLPDTVNHLYEYVKQNPDAALLTCHANRCSPLSRAQLLGGTINEDDSIRRHVMLAERQTKYLYKTLPINADISGYLMLISKRTWNEFKFNEGVGCLGLDTEFGRRIRKAGKKILLMQGVYCWHSYRLMNGIFDKKHLAV